MFFARSVRGVDPTTRALAAVLFAGLAARLLLAALLDPGLDEAYALAVSGRWQLSWFDHPPMTFWIAAAMRALGRPLFGGEPPVVWMRLPFVAAFTVTTGLIASIAGRLFGARAGLWTAVAVTLAPFFLVSAGSWIVPDGPLSLGLAATARLLVELLFFAPEPVRARRLWLLAGLALGFAGLSKYHAVLFAVGVFVFLVATPHRRVLARPEPWLAAALAVATVAPVLIWNAENDWVSFLFQSGRGEGTHADWRALGRTLLGQAAYLGPWTMVGALAAAIADLRRSATETDPSVLLHAVAWPPIVLFVLAPLAGGEALPHWPMPGWLFLLPLLGRDIARLEARTGAVPRAVAVSSIAAVGLLSVAAALFAGLRLLPLPAVAFADPRTASFVQETFRWDGLRDALAERGLLVRDAEGRPPVIVAPSWIEAARIGEALGGEATVAVFDRDPRGFAFLSNPRDFVGRDVVVVGRAADFERARRTVADLATTVDRPISVPLAHAGGRFLDLRVAVARRLTTAYVLPYPASRSAAEPSFRVVSH